MITLRVHPWFGETVTVFRKFGKDTVWIERPGYERRIVPLIWTDLHPLPAPPEVDGKPVRLSVAGALALSAWVSSRSADGQQRRSRARGRSGATKQVSSKT